MITTKTIPLMTPYVPQAAKRAAAAVLETRWIGQGPKVDEFEKRFSAQIVDGSACVAVSSGTAALHLAYILAGIGPGDEVIAPLFTCTLANEPLLWLRAKIRFCDVAPGSLNMDPAHALELITERTKAIVVVHYGGQPVDDRLFHLGVPVIEDCAHSSDPGFTSRGQFQCFSFQAVKHISTPDGGMLVVPDSLAAKAKRLRWAGIDREAKHAGTWENDIREAGYKYQMNDVAAAMGLEALKELDWQISYRKDLRGEYVFGLHDVPGITVTDRDPRSACWLMTVLVDRRREDLMRNLRENGVECDLVHYRNDRYSIFKEFRRPGEFPNMDAVEGKYLVLPLHMGMDVGDVARICDVIRCGW